MATYYGRIFVFFMVLLPYLFLVETLSCYVCKGEKDCDTEEKCSLLDKGCASIYKQETGGKSFYDKHCVRGMGFDRHCKNFIKQHYQCYTCTDPLCNKGVTMSDGGLKCYYSGIECVRYLPRSQVFDCMRNAAKEVKNLTCPSGSTACVKISIKLDDGEQLVVKGCFNPEISPDCEKTKALYGDRFQAKVECETCETDFCNKGTPSEATNNEEKHSRERHSGRSQSLATSSARIAYEILILNLLVLTFSTFKMALCNLLI